MDSIHLEDRKTALKRAVKYFMLYSIRAHVKGRYRQAAEKLEKARDRMRELKELEDRTDP